ncbi:MAG: thioredoxin domain-containing protein, partial [Gammaproteobacteria bacterium]
VWTPDEARALLDGTEFELVSKLYGLEREPNFEGRWHLHTFGDPEAIAAALSLTRDAFDEVLESARRKLFEAREQRIRPGRDEKILTSWNALMIRGMARAGRVLDEPAWIASAERALGFIRTTLWRDGRLLATFKDGKAHLNAYLDDHAYLIDAILELLQARWSDEELEFAIALADRLLEHFEDERRGGFYFTPDDHEQLIQRPRPMSDDAMPSGNGVAALALQRLGWLLGDLNYLDAAGKTLRAAWNRIESLPHAHGALLIALQEQLAPPEILIARGAAGALDAWRKRQQEDYRPERLCFAIPADAGVHEALAAKAPQQKPVVYRCKGMTCSPPEEL